MADLIDLSIFDVTPQQGIALQNQMREQMSLVDDLGEIKTVGGVDASVSRFIKQGKCAVVVLSFPELELIETKIYHAPITFPYIPGLLAFRELPIFFETWNLLAHKPDIVLFDGQGYAHPRRFGFACMAGVLLNLPTIGCAKSRMTGEYVEPAQTKGAASSLIAPEGDKIGDVVRTKVGCKPLFISPGHKISFETATDFVLRCTSDYRLPEPTRLAHLAAAQR